MRCGQIRERLLVRLDFPDTGAEAEELRHHLENCAACREVADRLDRISEGHQELETAQINQQRAHTKLEETLTAFIDETRERITNLTILVDRLVERDLGRSGGEI